MHLFVLEATIKGKKIALLCAVFVSSLLKAPTTVFRRPSHTLAHTRVAPATFPSPPLPSLWADDRSPVPVQPVVVVVYQTRLGKMPAICDAAPVTPQQHAGVFQIRLVGWLLNVPATCCCLSGTDLLRKLYVLPH